MDRSSKVNILPEAWEDYENLDDSLIDEVEYYLTKLESNRLLGQALEDKNGKELSNCRKIYFNKARHRIVYFIDSVGTIHISNIVAIGPRANEEVYLLAHTRLQKLNLK
ncbi:hypothetical protein B2H97_16080 [Paraclostridium bifermentans]|uniref:hypothetical protein n=1 Tax=Paraclostridium bifermentans TaxID=1490 RepID=UPI000A16EEF7|nr:hypothetical protein [Paraclostridium bifermentans]OSB07986.1 hypothetical protein B2H97_16080 [Paraclostridium bifermentans]